MSVVPAVNDRRTRAYIRDALMRASRHRVGQQAIWALLEPIATAWIVAEGGSQAARATLEGLLRYPEDFQGAQGRCDQAILRAALTLLDRQEAAHAEHVPQDATADGDRGTPPRATLRTPSRRAADDAAPAAGVCAGSDE